MPDEARPPAITQAIQLFRDGKAEESCACLRAFLLDQPANFDALLWLAKVTPDQDEAVAAAGLALKLNPANEVAQRAVIAVRQRRDESARVEPSEYQLAAAIALSAGMTLSQARAVRWPFRGINRPIGEMVEDGTLTGRDLGWAAEQAWDERVRQAATTVLLSRLLGVTPPYSPSPFRMVTGSRHSERQERVATLFGGLAFGVAFTLLFIASGGCIVMMVRQVGYSLRPPAWYCYGPGYLDNGRLDCSEAYEAPINSIPVSI